MPGVGDASLDGIPRGRHGEVRLLIWGVDKR